MEPLDHSVIYEQGSLNIPTTSKRLCHAENLREKKALKNSSQIRPKVRGGWAPVTKPIRPHNNPNFLVTNTTLLLVRNLQKSLNED